MTAAPQLTTTTSGMTPATSFMTLLTTMTSKYIKSTAATRTTATPSATSSDAATSTKGNYLTANLIIQVQLFNMTEEVSIFWTPIHHFLPLNPVSVDCFNDSSHIWDCVHWSLPHSLIPHTDSSNIRPLAKSKKAERTRKRLTAEILFFCLVRTPRFSA